MYFDVDELDLGRSYKLLSSCVTPRPIAWVVTRSAEGRHNAAPYSLFNFFGGHPPVIAIGMGERAGQPKDSLRNILQFPEFVVNLVPAALAQAMNDTATEFAPDVDELEVVGMDREGCRKVAVPRIAQSPVALECRMRDVIDLDTAGALLLANVVGIHIADEAVIDPRRCHIDTSKLDLIGRLESPGWYTHTASRFKMTLKKPEDFQATSADTER